ncbi:hypothetical protein [Pseudoteredinibacter isoporae]|uniref:Uncharacterized protein n=1 Tax=Pseudoteredinibacter isoporae TaxID=570281 RepID=A0A7X0MVL1_9GAMM|nr:hypothetical protein [Pseudoteredinibacter isoporae]MBB6519964.1 hypothetical protein [Pseudoteredinibacter isoporae]NHO85536.1 hypothetical protein [Pseudoteredinibacter isoporae]NIB26012.1 hypothetical protein [Pseudoteredinibacter isoporae]
MNIRHRVNVAKAISTAAFTVYCDVHNKTRPHIANGPHVAKKEGMTMTKRLPPASKKR